MLFIRQNGVFPIIILFNTFACCLLPSCSTSKHMAEGTGPAVEYDNQYSNYKGLDISKATPYTSTNDLNFGVNYHLPSSLFSYHGTQFAVGQEVVNGPAERNRMARLQKKLAKHPEQKEKYMALISKKYYKLMQKREKRIQQKLEFLNELYSNITNNDYEKFGSQCKRHCANRVLENLNEICKATYSRETVPFWYLFSDKETYKPQDIKIRHIRYSDYNRPELKDYYKFMYGDSTHWENDAIPFTDADARWYQVKLGKQPIFLRLEGTGKFVLITGLINPKIKLAIKDGQDNDNRRWRFG